MAVVVLVIVIILLAVGIHSCDVSAHKSALSNYATSVDGIVQKSNAIGPTLFGDLSGKNGSCSGGQALSQCVTDLASTSRKNLAQLEGLSVPGGMQQAQSNLVLALKMRHDGLNAIAGNVQPAYTSDTATDALGKIQTGIAQLFASDVVYKAYAAKDIAAALNAAGIEVGGSDGVSIAGGQILTDLNWLQTSTIAAGLGVQVPGSPAIVTPKITVVAPDDNTMVPGVTNHVKASPPPAFVITVVNPGKGYDNAVICSVTVHGIGDTASSTIPSIGPGDSGTCTVTLPTSPPVSTTPVDVTATVTPGVSATKTATETFPIEFLGS